MLSSHPPHSFNSSPVTADFTFTFRLNKTTEEEFSDAADVLEDSDNDNVTLAAIYAANSTEDSAAAAADDDDNDDSNETEVDEDDDGISVALCIPQRAANVILCNKVVVM